MNLLLKNSQDGQALVELAAVLPVFLLFFLAILPLAAYGVFPTWLDERLAMTLLAEDRTRVPAILPETRNGSRVPVYPATGDLEERLVLRRAGILSASLPGVLPARVAHSEISAPLPPGGLIAGIQSDSLSAFSGTVTRDLELYLSHSLTDKDAIARVKGWSLVGALKGKDRVFRSLGLELFHLSLDAVPPKPEREATDATP